MVMRLTSSAFAPGRAMPTRFTCDGANFSPPLAWSGQPDTARSFVIVCRDPDAPGRTFYHWAVYDLPAAIDRLPEGWAARAAGARQAVNDFGQIGYGGPCPPHGHGTHHYHFVIHALDIAELNVPARAGCDEVERAAGRHSIASAELIGIYSR